MHDIVLETHDLTYAYPDGTPALTGIAIKIRRGLTTAVIGGNGAGKSTLSLCLNGIIKPLSGQVLYAGVPVDYSRRGLRKLRTHVGLVFQDPDNQLFSASVYQDVSFGPLNLHLPEAEVRRRVLAALEQTGILAQKDKPTHSLSFGQKKRAAMAGVLAMEPEVIILDEPTAGLDPRGVSEMMKFLTDAKKKLQLSVVISTHDMDLVPLYCDYVYVMDKGSIILQGTPEEIFAQPNILRSVHLRLPRIAHLMEILQKEDHFHLETRPSTIAGARRALKKLWQEEHK